MGGSVLEQLLALKVKVAAIYVACDRLLLVGSGNSSLDHRLHPNLNRMYIVIFIISFKFLLSIYFNLLSPVYCLQFLLYCLQLPRKIPLVLLFLW